jgi:hypothetical protein
VTFPPGSCQAGYQSAADRIGVIRHDDGNRRRGAPRGFGRRRGPRDDDVHFEPNQLRCKGGESFDSVLVISSFNDEILTLNVPQLPHPLKESLPEAHLCGRRGTRKKAYAIDP